MLLQSHNSLSLVYQSNLLATRIINMNVTLPNGTIQSYESFETVLNINSSGNLMLGNGGN